MSRRPMLLLPTMIAALALPIAPALAGEDDGDGGSGTATLHSSQGCVHGSHAKARVTGENIDQVAFYVDGKLVTTVTHPGGNGGYRMSMRCSRLSFGAHKARAAVSFTSGTSPANMTLRFQITRVAHGSARFTG
jgi:hypothetical protein